MLIFSILPVEVAMSNQLVSYGKLSVVTSTVSGTCCSHSIGVLTIGDVVGDGVVGDDVVGDGGVGDGVVGDGVVGDRVVSLIVGGDEVVGLIVVGTITGASDGTSVVGSIVGKYDGEYVGVALFVIF